MTTRRYYSTRQLVDVDEFLSLKDESYLMCVSGSMLYALRKMAKTRLLWTTTYAKEKYEQTYLLPGASDFDQIDAVVSEWIADTEDIEMCNAALIDALEGIANAVKQSSCCFEGGPGGQYDNGDWYWGTQTPQSAPTVFGPGEEFETEEEYNSHKCEAANGIVNGLIGSLSGFGILTLFSLTAASLIAGMVGVGLLAIPPVAIILAVLGTGLLFAVFTSLANQLETNRVLLVCGLYSSTTAIGAYNVIKNFVEGLQVPLGVTSVQIKYLSDLIMQMSPIDTMNSLFSSVGLPEIPGDLVDCAAECGVCDEVFMQFGTWDGVLEQASSALDEVSEPDRNVINMRFNYDGADYCGEPVTITLTEISGSPNGHPGLHGYRIFNQTDGLVYSHDSDPPPGAIANVGRMYLYNDIPGVPFVVGVTIT